jgi:hypothetical protein
MALKASYPHLKLIIGIATETQSPEPASYDLMYIDVSKWSEADLKEAKETQQELELLLPQNLNFSRVTANEYPKTPTYTTISDFKKPNLQSNRKKADKKKKSVKLSRKTNRRK